MTLAALIHVFVMGGAVLWFCRRIGLPWRDGPFAVYILLWTSLVFAGHMASLPKVLGSLAYYVPISMAAMALLVALFLYVGKLRARKPLLVMPCLEWGSIGNPKLRRYLYAFLGFSFAFVALSSIAIGLSVFPDNADSMIYRLPRAFWYVSHDSFLHPFRSFDNRLTFYPLNGVALYVPFVLYGLPGTAHSLPSLVTWYVVVYATYRFARELGAERLVAFFAAWLVGLTPSILAQATSTNDEILAAAAFMLCLYMGWRWLVDGRHVYLLFAAVALGLSVGTKLHIIFLSPIIVAALGLAAWHVRQKPERMARWLEAVGWRTGLVCSAMLVTLIVPFLFYNYASSGRFYFFGEFEREVFNLSANLRGAFQNLLIYVSQMIFAPIADLNTWPVANDRQRFNNMLNAVFDPLLRPLIDPDPKFYHLGYRFVGITLPVSVRFVEFSLWSAFVWLLWPLQARLALKQKFALRGLFFLIAITPPVWLLLWSFSTLYMEGTATYFTFYLICAAPAAVFSFGYIRRAIWNEVRWVVIVFVALTNLVICFNLLMYSGFRALPDLYYAQRWPYDWLLMEPRIVEEIRKAKKIRIVALHEKMPYFAFMHWNPKARYGDPFPPPDIQPSDEVLQIFPVSSLDRYGFMVLRVPDKKTVGVTYLGAIRGIGREAIFASGNEVHKRYPEESNYVFLQVNVLPHDQGGVVATSGKAVGLNIEDNLEFRFEMVYENRVIYTRDWENNPDFRVNVEGYDPFIKPALLTIGVRSAWNHKELTRVTYRVGGNGAWLPEGSEY